MKKTLVSLLEIEEKVSGVIELDMELGKIGLLGYARKIDYHHAMRVVVGCCKPARALRSLGPDGINTNEESVAAFRQCAERLLDIADKMDDDVVKALVLHGAATCYARGNGNKPEDQLILNRTAQTTLLGLSARHQGLAESGDWRTVYAKVLVDLYEQDVRTFVEGPYRRLIHMMECDGSKDAAGRRLFLARWLADAGRREDAIAALEPVEDPDYRSVPDQIEEVLRYLAELRASELR